MNTMHDEWTERLSEFLDGALGWDDQARLEAHLDDCAECTATLSDLRQVVARADGLEDLPPTRELWSGIVERIEAESRAEQSRAGGDVVDIRGRAGVRNELRPWQRRLSFSVPQLAAAGIATILMSAGAAWIALSSQGDGSELASAGGPNAGLVANQAPRIVAPPSVTLTGTDLPLITKYETAIEDLEEALRVGEGNLEPETVATLRHSLAVIDRAINEAREALAADPGSAYLNTHLADTMRRKMDLLRYANYFATAQS